MRSRSLFGALSMAVALSACGSSSGSDDDASFGDARVTNVADDGGSSTGTDAASSGDGAVSTAGDGGAAQLPDGSPFQVNGAGQVLCGSDPCACSDGLDNDNDGLIDLADPECISSWDNDEGSLATGISGDNRDDACQDCFFDGNSGAGDDQCRLPTSCLLTGDPSSGRGSCNTCEQSDQCKNFCQAYTPNGCDCFGCCEIHVAGEVKNLMLEPGCDIDGSTLTGCTECVPSTTCVNECGECELCPGKTVADLPAKCFPSESDAGVDAGTDASVPPVYTCDNGETRCGAGVGECAAGEICSFGCCILAPVTLL